MSESPKDARGIGALADLVCHRVVSGKMIVDGTETKHRIDSIQWLRGFAALVVLICHVDAESANVFGRKIIPLSEYGINGVDIFFVISGFIIWLTTTQARSFSSSDFIAKRVIRVAPTYWIYSAAFFSCYFILPGLFSRAVMTWSDLLKSLFFIPHYNAIGDLSPVIAIGWTLNFEMFFYAVFCLVRSRTRHIILPLSVIFAALVLIGALTHPASAMLLSYSCPIVFEFVFGCLIARAFVSGRRIALPIAIASLIAALALSLYLPVVIPDNGSLTPLDTWRFVARGLPSALLVLVISCGRFWTAGSVKPLLFLGDISYSLYLTHTLTLRVVFAVYKRLPIQGAEVPAAVAAAIAICLVAAALAYLLVEKPLTSVLTRGYRRMSVRGPAMV